MFTLKKVSYNQRLSHETHAFSADLWLNGKKVAEVSNAGHGGCDDLIYMNDDARDLTMAELARLTPPARTDREKAELIRNRIVYMYGIGDSSYDLTMNNRPDDELLANHSDLLTMDWLNPNLENIVCDLMNEWLAERELKKLMAKRVLWTKKESRAIWQTQCARNAAHRDKWIAQVANERDTNKILNNMPIAQAVALFKASTAQGGAS